MNRIGSSVTPPQAEAAAMRAIGGIVRDSLASLQNLYTLLHSPKVGPKAILGILPEIRQNCELIGNAVAALVLDASPHFSANTAAQELILYTRNGAAEMIPPLIAMERAGVDARARLALEAQVQHVVPQLEASRLLVDLLHDAAYGSPVELRLRELMEETFSYSLKSAWPWGAPVTVCVTFPSQEDYVTISPRVAIPLMLAAIAYVHGKQSEQSAQGVCILPRKNGAQTALEIACVPSKGLRAQEQRRSLRLPILIDLSPSVMLLVAEKSRAKIDLSDESPYASIGFETQS